MASPRVLLPLLLITAVFTLGATTPDAQQGDARPRYMLLRGEHTLLPEEREALEQIGCRVVRELGQREYIVRITPAARARLTEQPFVAEVDGIPESWRVHPSARRELSRFGPLARLDVLFHDDVTFDDAAEAVARSGGWLGSPLEIDFKLPRRLEIVLPDDRLEQMAANDVVLQIHGPMPPIIPMNAQAAALSSVPPLHAAPYQLSGAGVVVSVWDLGETGPGLADVTHNEFEGRVEKFGNFPIAEHATHVTGTIAAKGLNPQAKGMAPAVRVQNFAAQDSFLDDKEANFTRLGIRADNNSWGFVHGWNNAGRGWEWYGDDRGENDQLFGAYGIATSALDALVREHQTLIILAAGNDNSDPGPTLPPFEHFHEERATRYCYSTDGSGTDCPPTCAQCETVRHKRDGPFQTMNLVASGKNTIAVGAVSSSKGVTSFSARGPTRDGRIKPDIVAKGFSMLSTFPNQAYQISSGTSMAAPVVTGITALLIEQWRKTFGGTTPSPEALRVLLVHGAEDLTTPPSGVSVPLVGPDYAYGFGLVNAKESVDTIIGDGSTGSRIKSGTVSQGATAEYTMALAAGATARITLGWSDPEAIPYPARALVNDLDLRVIRPDGTTLLPFVLNPADPAAIATRGVNNIDTLEQVVVENAMAGSYRVQVLGTAISTTTPQTFVLASSAAMGPQIFPCVDVYEPNDTVESAFGRLPSGTSLTGRMCVATDVDFYRFVVDRSGTVRVTVTPSDTPLRVTLFQDGALLNTISPQPGATSSIQFQLGTGTNQPITPVSYTVQIVPNGQIGPIASYVLTVTFNHVPAGRQRVVRH